MSKFVESEISTIKNLATMEIPQIVQAANGAAAPAYDTKRFELNVHLIQALCGAEVGDIKKGKRSIKFNHSLPSAKQVAQIVAIMDKFCTEVESAYFSAVAASQAAAAAQSSGDMSIPPQPVPMVYSSVGDLDKATNKKLRDYLFGSDGYTGVSVQPIRGADCAMIAAIGQEARTNANIKKALIIGGIVLVVAGAGTAGYLYYRHEKEKKELAESSEEVAAEVEEIEDVPHVEMGFMPAFIGVEPQFI